MCGIETHKTNFDFYLEENLKKPDFAARFAEAGEAWDIALQLSALREESGLSQKELAAKLHTSQQHISRIESPGYEGRSLCKLRKVATALNARVRVILEPLGHTETPARVKEEGGKYLGE